MLRVNLELFNEIVTSTGYKGTIEMIDPHRYVISGEVAVLGRNEVEITELPIRVWTQAYKESVMEVLLHGSEKAPALINDYKEYHTDTTVRFLVNVIDDKLEKAESDGLHRLFKLQSTMTTTSMVLFDANGCLKRYDSIEEILREFYVIRLKFYDKRKNYLEGILQAESTKLTNQARFICEKCDNILILENKKSKDLIEELRRRKYDPDPVKVWKLAQDKEAVLEEVAEQNVDEEEQEKQVATVKGGDFDYLLDMPIRSLTYERKEELMKKRDAKMTEYNILRAKSPSDLWKEDLNVFMEVLKAVEEEETETVVKKEKKLPMIAAKKTKKALKDEVMPSPKGRRIAPVIDSELRKKVERANQAKETKAKKALKQSPGADIEVEKDMFDLEEGDKSLGEKLGLTPPKGVKKKAIKKPDGMKQTKLNFGAGGKKGKKGTMSDDDGDVIGSDEKDEFDAVLDQAPLR